jgi:hypothetical protein
METFILEVYGEAEYLLMALKSVAAIFSFKDYKSLLGIFIIVGIFVTTVGILFKIDRGFVSIQLLLLYFAGASMLITACTVPTSKVTVHDMVKNRFEEVYNVPTVLAFMAYAFNNIENGLKDIIISAAGPINDPTVVGKGEGIDTLSKLDEIPYLMSQSAPTFVKNLKLYMAECVQIEIGLGKLSIDTLNSTQNLWTAIKSQNNAAFTRYYEGNATTAISCNQAYTKLNAAFNVAAGRVGQLYCENRGYKGIANTSKCTGDLDTVLKTFVVGDSAAGSGIDGMNIIINLAVADALAYARAMAAGRNPQEFGADQAYLKTVGGQYQMSIAANR